MSRLILGVLLSALSLAAVLKIAPSIFLWIVFVGLILLLSKSAKSNVNNHKHSGKIKNTYNLIIIFVTIVSFIADWLFLTSLAPLFLSLDDQFEQLMKQYLK